jgi:hypothetical protein
MPLMQDDQPWKYVISRNLDLHSLGVVATVMFKTLCISAKIKLAIYASKNTDNAAKCHNKAIRPRW